MCFSLQPGHYPSLPTPNLQPTANQVRNDQCGNQHYSRELQMMGIVVPETCWAYKKCNKIRSGILLVFILQLSQWCMVQQTSNWLFYYFCCCYTRHTSVLISVKHSWQCSTKLTDNVTNKAQKLSVTTAPCFLASCCYGIHCNIHGDYIEYMQKTHSFRENAMNNTQKA